MKIDVKVRRKRPVAVGKRKDAQGKRGPLDLESKADYLKRRSRGGITLYDLGQTPVGDEWETLSWILHREPLNTGVDEVPSTESFADSGGPATHNANFTDLTVEQLSTRRVRTKTESGYYGGTVLAGALSYSLDETAAWRGNKVSVPAGFYQEDDFIINHGNFPNRALFAENIILKGPGVFKITQGNTFASPAVAYSPGKSDVYYFVPLPVQHLATSDGGVIVDVSAFRYRPRVDLDTPATIVEWSMLGLNPVIDPVGYNKFLQACEFQSGLTEQSIWFVPETSSPFQFVNIFPTTAAALNTTLMSRPDFATQGYGSWFASDWFNNDQPEGMLVLIIRQEGSLFYVWSDF